MVGSFFGKGIYSPVQRYVNIRATNTVEQTTNYKVMYVDQEFIPQVRVIALLTFVHP